MTPPPPPRKAEAGGSAGALLPRTLPFANPLFSATPERPPPPAPPERNDSLVDVPLSPMPPPQAFAQAQQAR